MSADAPHQGMPPFNLSQHPLDDTDQSSTSRFQLSRNMPSSDDGHATVNLPRGSDPSTHQHGLDSMGFNGNFGGSSAMSNSISSLHSNGPSSTGSGGHGSIGRSGFDPTGRLRHNFNSARSSSPLSRPPLFSPNLLHEVERSSQQVRSPSGSHPASSPPPRSNVTSPRYFTEPHASASSHQHPHQSLSHQQHHVAQPQQHQHPHPPFPHQHPQDQHQYPSSQTHNQHGQQQQTWQSRNGAMGPLDFPPSSLSPSTDRPQSSMSERTSRAMAPGTAQSPVGSSTKDSEFSIFVGDLSPDLREEDLVAQFLQPPAWPSSHPFASALIHAQQTQGIYQPGSHIGPAPFHSTKSAKIMTDPVTGISKGYGFVRFALEADCNRALVEMQGVVVSPSNGLSPGRPLRVSTATPKNRGVPPQFGPNVPGDPIQQHLQMPRPQNPAQNANASFLYGGAPAGPPGSRSEVVSPQPHARQQSSPSNSNPLTSPISPPSTFDGPGGNSSVPTPFGPLYGGFPGSLGDGTRDSSPSGMMRSHTPSSGPPMMQHSGANNPGDSAADPNNTTVFVGGLSSLISEQTLRRYFEHFGEITYVKIPPGKGCGFVQYVRKQDAENAIQRMNGFPILNSKIRLSWGRSQGDKAAAAAAQTMAQYAQLGQLAGLAGLSSLSPSQLAQLAGLGSALSAVQAQAQVQTHAQRGLPGFGGAASGALANDPLSTLARQLAAANLGVGAGIGPLGPGNQVLPGMGQRAPLPAFLQNQQQPQQQLPSHHQGGPHLYQPQQQRPNQFAGQPGLNSSSQQGGLSSMGADGAMAGTYEGGSIGSLSSHGFDFNQRGEFGGSGQDGADRSRGPLPPHNQQGDASGMPHQLSESELIHAFANLDFDESTRAALAQRLQAMQGGAMGRNPSDGFGAGPNAGHGQRSASGRVDPFASGYNRDPNAFMFSPFSPADSPVAGGKDLPASRSSTSSFHLSHSKQDEAAGIKDTVTSQADH